MHYVLWDVIYPIPYPNVDLDKLPLKFGMDLSLYPIAVCWCNYGSMLETQSKFSLALYNINTKISFPRKKTHIKKNNFISWPIFNPLITGRVTNIVLAYALVIGHRNISNNNANSMPIVPHKFPMKRLLLKRISLGIKTHFKEKNMH